MIPIDLQETGALRGHWDCEKSRDSLLLHCKRPFRRQDVTHSIMNTRQSTKALTYRTTQSCDSIWDVLGYLCLCWPRSLVTCGWLHLTTARHWQWRTTSMTQQTTACCTCQQQQKGVLQGRNVCSSWKFVLYKLQDKPLRKNIVIVQTRPSRRHDSSTRTW